MQSVAHATTPITPVKFNDPLNNQQLALCNNVREGSDYKISLFIKFWQTQGGYWRDFFCTLHEQSSGGLLPMAAASVAFGGVAGVSSGLGARKLHREFYPKAYDRLSNSDVYHWKSEKIIPYEERDYKYRELEPVRQQHLTNEIIAGLAGAVIGVAVGFVGHAIATLNSQPYLEWKNRYLENSFLERDDILSNFLCPLTGELPDIPAYIYGCGHNEYMTVDFLRAVEILHNNVGQLFPHTKLTCSASLADRTDPAKKYVSTDNLYLDYAFLHTFACRGDFLRRNLITRLEAGQNNADSLTTLIDSVSQKLFEKAEIYNESRRRRNALALPSPFQTVGQVSVFPAKCITAREGENACSKFFRELFTPEKPYVRLSVIRTVNTLKCLTGEELNEPHAEARFFSEFPNVDPSPLFHFPGDKI